MEITVGDAGYSDDLPAVVDAVSFAARLACKSAQVLNPRPGPQDGVRLEARTIAKTHGLTAVVDAKRLAPAYYA
jgi:hypothetical protein